MAYPPSPQDPQKTLDVVLEETEVKLQREINKLDKKDLSQQEKELLGVLNKAMQKVEEMAEALDKKK